MQKSNNVLKYSVYLLLGSNLGKPEEYLKMARSMLSQRVGIVEKTSSLYRTEPWGFRHENFFLNQVLCVRTDLNPETLLELIHSIEADLGRVRLGNGYQARTIDIDILLYDQQIVNQPELQIPHLRLHERRFTLLPLVEIAPTLKHPVFNLTVSELLAHCDDECEVQLAMECIL